MKQISHMKWTAVAAAGLLLSGCGGHSHETAAQHRESSPPALYVVPIVSASGKTIGEAKFRTLNDGVAVHVKVAELAPGLHGIHFHETGKCEPPAFTTTGAHLNPYGKQHGFANPKGPHVGDLPNLDVNQEGFADIEFITKQVSLQKGASNSLLKEGGSSIVIHEKADDLKTDPAGNSGARIACGVIR